MYVWQYAIRASKTSGAQFPMLQDLKKKTVIITVDEQMMDGE